MVPLEIVAVEPVVVNKNSLLPQEAPERALFLWSISLCWQVFFDEVSCGLPGYPRL